MPQSLSSLAVHIVFSTKHREPFITPDLVPNLYPFIGGIVRRTGSRLVSIGGIADHIHLLVYLGRQACVADLVRNVKCNSSSWVHESHPDRQYYAWQSGYGAFAVSKSHVPLIRDYIANQEAHHKLQSYQDEFREYLRTHEIEWDERYVWD